MIQYHLGGVVMSKPLKKNVTLDKMREQEEIKACLSCPYKVCHTSGCDRLRDIRRKFKNAKEENN